MIYSIDVKIIVGFIIDCYMNPMSNLNVLMIHESYFHFLHISSNGGEAKHEHILNVRVSSSVFLLA